MVFAAALGVPPSFSIASDLRMGRFYYSFRRGAIDPFTIVDSSMFAPFTLPGMQQHKKGPMRDRLVQASIDAGLGGDSPAVRRALQDRLKISPAAVSKLFRGGSANFSAANVFLAADVLRCDPRWLATGEGTSKQTRLPTDVSEVAEELNAIADPDSRRAVLAVSRMLAKKPASTLVSIMTAMANPPQQRLSEEAYVIAAQLDSIEDPEIRKIAIAKAQAEAFRSHLPPATDEEPAAEPAPARPAPPTGRQRVRR